MYEFSPTSSDSLSGHRRLSRFPAPRTHSSKNRVYTEKEIVALSTKAGVNAGTCADVNQALVDDALVDKQERKREVPFLRKRTEWNRSIELLLQEGQFQKHFRITKCSMEFLVGILAEDLRIDYQKSVNRTKIRPLTLETCLKGPYGTE